VRGSAAHHSFDARTFYVREHSPHNAPNVQFFKCPTRVPPPVEWGVTCEQQFTTNCSTGSDSEAVAGIPLPAKAGSPLPSTLMECGLLVTLNKASKRSRVAAPSLLDDMRIFS